MAEDSESAASQQSLELDDQDTCGIDGDNEEENEHMQGWGWPGRSAWRRTNVISVSLFISARMCVCARAR